MLALLGTAVASSVRIRNGRRPSVALYGVIILGIVGFSASARARPLDITITDAKHHFSLTIPATSEVTEMPATGPHLAHATLGTMQMSLSRIDHSNVRAYRKHDKKQFISEVLAGVRKNPGTRLEMHNFAKSKNLPTLDLRFSRTKMGGEIVWMRFLFFRRYALVATATLPTRSSVRNRRVAKQFTDSLSPQATK